MMRYKFAVGTIAAAFALSAAPTLAQQPRSQDQQPASRPAGGAERTGTATPRGDGGSAAPRSGGDTSVPGGGSGMSGGGSMGSSSSPSAPSSSGTWGQAPRRAPVAQGIDAPDRSQQRAPRSGGQGSGRTAVPRGGSASGGDRSSGGGRVTSGSGSGGSQAATSSASADRSSGPARRAVPSYSRPRDGRPATGEAVERRRLPSGGTNIFFNPRPYYSPYGFWGPGFGFGLGYLYYDPFWYGSYGYPYYGGGYYGGGYYGGGGGYYGGSGSYGQSYRETGAVRLRIKPREAEVYVDGYYVGVVDDFDGTFQRLTLEAGPRRIEIRAQGYQTETVDMLVTPGETLTYRGDLKPIQ